MTTSTISRRHFLGAVGATVAGFGATRLFGAEPPKDNIRLGMMLQGGSAAELQEKARAIATAGFDMVQVFEPYFPHVVGTVELAKEVLAPFPAHRVGLLLDPPNFITPALYPKREEEMRRLFRHLGERIHLAHFKDLKLNPAGQGVDLPGPGDGEMNYPLLISEIRKLNRPLPCIIEHIKTEPAEITKTKAWVEKQLRQNPRTEKAAK